MTYLVIKQLNSNTKDMKEINCRVVVPGDAMLLGDGDFVCSANGGFCRNREIMCNEKHVMHNKGTEVVIDTVAAL